jgi:hypothetical protein
MIKTLSIKKILITAFFILGYSAAFINFLLLSVDMIHGNGYGEKAVPQPFFGFTRMHEKPNTLEHNAINRLAVDFAQVYFPSQEFSALTQNYETGYLDPWKRPSRYAPAVHFICSLSICKLDYGYASFAHMLIQIILFYLFFVFAFKILKMEEDMTNGVFIATLVLFVTPAGLGWLERGQFSLYVCLAYLLLILGLMKKNSLLIVASALFAYIKWTSLPFLFVIIVVHLSSSKDRKEFIKNSNMALIYLLIILFLSLAFRSRFIHFIEGLLLQEAYEEPSGISMTLLLPVWVVKGFPLVSIFWGYLCLVRNNRNFDKLIPFLTGTGILMLTYPTVAFEYNIPTLLCFIPLIFYWAKPLTLIHRLVKYGFVLFIFLISYSNHIGIALNGDGLLLFYLFVSCLIAMVPLLHPESSHSQAEASALRG